jgi:xylulokinase
MAHAIGIDVGSTNVKVALVGDNGKLEAATSRTLTCDRDGDIAEQDAEAMWTGVVDAVSELTSQAPEVAADVTDIGVCSQYSSIVPVDESGRPVADLVMWSDQRGTAHSWAIMDEHPDAFEVFVERHGIPPIGGGLALGHILHIQKDRPEVHDATAAYLEPMDYVNARFTGELTATQCTMFMAQVCDNREIGVTEYDDELVRRAGIDPAKLPRLIPVDGVAGQLRAEVAAQLGLQPGLTVHAAMNDSQAGAFASGAFTRGRGGLAIGTTAVLVDTVAVKKTDLDNELVSMVSPVPGQYLAWAENGISGQSVEYVLDHILFASDELADHSTDELFASLEKVLASVAPGSEGVIFLPWLSGSLAPEASRSTRGAFLNLGLESERVHLVRSMIEGTAHNLRWLLPALEGFTEQSIDEIMFYGGAARSPGWAQVLADVLDTPIRTLADPDFAVAKTVGLRALQGSGRLGSDDLESFVVVDTSYDPDANTREVYDAMHEQFVAAFSALRPIYDALNG